ncbi:MAG: flagellar filament capping protein FliD [Bryobacteraceae bacterium]|jgi:flagellar hook-associated protein 2
MGTTTAASAASTTAPTYFTGVSTYASDLQQVITRAVNIASMPLQLMQSQQQELTDEGTALDGLNSQFSSLQTAVQNLDTALGPSSYTATSSDPTAVSASAAAGAMDGTYSITVNDPGSSAAVVSSSSLPVVTDPSSSSISSATAFTLTVGSKTFSIQPADTSLIGLATAINEASAGVQASIVNAGGSSSPNYLLVLQATSLGPTSIDLTEGPPGQTPPGADLIDSTPLNAGTDASYTIGGLNQTIQTTSSSVTLAPGLTINLLQKTTAPVTVTVSQSMDSVSSALSSFVSAYNSTVTALDQQVGQSGGALAGQSIVQSLFGSLRQITQYSSTSGAIASLAQMGVTLDDQGQMSFDASIFNSQSTEAIQGFLGGLTTGGFLEAANNALTSVEDSTSGTLTTAISSNTTEVNNENTLITAEQQKITTLQNNLTQQMAAADTLLASLQSQATEMNDLFTNMMNENVSNNNSTSSSS